MHLILNKRWFKIGLPITVIALSLFIGQQLFANKPKVTHITPIQKIIKINAKRLHKENYLVHIKSHGTVRPRTESTLIPQVTGRIIKILPNFREGGFFEKGDTLLQIDPRDYKISISVVEAQLVQAQLALEEEQARADVAAREWNQLSTTQLALRKPHLAAKNAALASAKAQLARAKLDLDRTQIKAPFAGRVLKQHVDIGQYVAPGTILAQIYAVDYVEIRLPLTSRQQEFIDLPERFRNDTNKHQQLAPVKISAQIGRTKYTWQGRLVRTEGAIDTQSRQLFVVAQVDDPYNKGPSGRPPLRVGQFIEAEITGKLLQDVFVIPRSALRNGQEVVLVNEQNQLELRAVQIAWQDDKIAVVSNGLHDHPVISLTQVTGVINGINVTVMIENEDIKQTQQLNATTTISKQNSVNQKQLTGTSKE